MKLTLRQYLVEFGHLLQASLFPRIEEEIGELGARARLLVQVLALAPLSPWLQRPSGPGRPCEDRQNLATAFLAKAVYNCVTTRQLIDLLRSSPQVRRLCGWNRVSDLPHESTFSRAFAEFAQSQLPQQLHQALITARHGDRLVGHISRDSTAIEARERIAESRLKPAAQDTQAQTGYQDNKDKKDQKDTNTAEQKEKKEKKSKADKKYKKRPKRAKANQRGTLIERQRQMSLEEMLAGLPTECGIGAKKSSNGQTQYWSGFKLHLDVADGQIPISAILTSANVHDSQVAIPLMTMTGQRVTYLYDLMDSAYDADAILEHSRSLEHVPIVPPHPRRNGKSQSILPKVFEPKVAQEMPPAQQQRYKERTTVERVHARLKDEFGGRHIRVRGPAKVFAHLSFGLVALTVDQLLKLTT
jgi:Transposase DDE domain/Transposase domain (DUF772)